MNAVYILVPLVGIRIMALGLASVAAAAWRSHRTVRRLEFIRSLGSEAELYADAAPVVERVQTPLLHPSLRPDDRWPAHIALPAVPVERDRPCPRRPAQGGTDRFGAGRGVRRGAGGIGHARVRRRPRRAGQRRRRLEDGPGMLLILPMVGGLAPSYWLRHRIKVRREQVTNDLPDLLDLMTISVAAGLGLEQAMQVSCARFESPVCHELRLTLREMELGLSRHDALENMKLRTDIDDLVTFAVVLSQADALGLPIGRVLQAQADEMRDKRRQRAREKAAKVPVKILFPLALCFLPAILIVVLGPIVGPIKHAFHGAG